ncbi:hypothetical protein LXL04_000331 [Taraxacum kok-saghyz]
MIFMTIWGEGEGGAALNGVWKKSGRFLSPFLHRDRSSCIFFDLCSPVLDLLHPNPQQSRATLAVDRPPSEPTAAPTPTVDPPPVVVYSGNEGAFLRSLIFRRFDTDLDQGGLLCWRFHELIEHSGAFRWQQGFDKYNADIWSTSSAAEACRCGPQTVDVLTSKKQIAPKIVWGRTEEGVAIYCEDVIILAVISFIILMDFIVWNEDNESSNFRQQDFRDDYLLLEMYSELNEVASVSVT